MEDYKSFLDRTNSFETQRLKLGNDYFSPRESLKLKVNRDNSFSPFYGDTVVFPLSSNEIVRLGKITDNLYNATPECFAERLPDETFHVTLHDLSNSNSKESVKAEIEKYLQQIKEIQSGRRIPNYTIHMRSNNIINMVNTSIVLALHPCSQEDYQHLMETYDIFEHVKPLPYPYTPHITLAYYNINGFDEDSAKKLSDTATRLNQDLAFEFNISTSDLVYQTFKSMKDYKDVLSFGTLPSFPEERETNIIE